MTRAQIIQATAYILSMDNPLPNDIPLFTEQDDCVFKFTINITSSSHLIYRFSINLIGSVDWGDGTINEYNLPSGNIDVEHRYRELGVYQIKIYGDLTNFGTIGVSAGTSYIDYSMISVDKKFPATMNGHITSSLTSGFDNAIQLKSIPKGLFDNCPDTTNLGMFFKGCSSLATIPSGLFDKCSHVTSFEDAFNGCTSLVSIPYGLFDNCVSVTSFGWCFYNCTSLTTIPYGLFDNCTSVTRFSSCFYGCSGIISAVPDLWNTHSEANGPRCFYGCQNASNYSSIPSSWR